MAGQMMFHGLFIVCLSMSSGFRLSPDDITLFPGIYTHDKITQKGVYKAVQTFIERFQLIDDTSGTSEDVINRYFGTDLDGLKRFQGVIDGFSQVFQIDKKDTRAFIHVYCEEIQMAHDHIIRLKRDIQHHASVQELSTDMIGIIRTKIAHALYTLQNFYSNTNWVEMHLPNATIYEDFGRPGWQLMAIARSSTDTCQNCKAPFCGDNLIRSDVLTSGYISGVQIMKPFRQSDSSVGKCSHGGSRDNTSVTVARGGINKETNNPMESPHYLLHGLAYKSAIMATEAFFISNETGLLNILGKENFKKVLEIHSTAKAVNTSLAFNIDTTGSMSDEISAVIQTTTDMVTRVMDSVNRPADYVLATFNDPDSTGFRTTDGGRMIRELKSLRAFGGGDCPEYTMHGLLKAIGLSRNNSRVYTFTDADPKDRNLWDQVLQHAKAKNIHLSFIVTGTCDRFDKRSVQQNGQMNHPDLRVQLDYNHIQSRSLQSFEDLANQTHGVHMFVSKEELLNGGVASTLLTDHQELTSHGLDTIFGR